MFNPSTADATVNDPTIRRCIAFSQAWGYGSLIVVNLWAARATNPKALFTLGDPCGPDNAEAISLAINGSAAVVLAWGAFTGPMKSAERLRPEESAREALVPVYTLGRTKHGHPRHPLYVRGDTALVPVWLPEPKDGSRSLSASGSSDAPPARSARRRRRREGES